VLVIEARDVLFSQEGCEFRVEGPFLESDVRTGIAIDRPGGLFRAFDRKSLNNSSDMFGMNSFCATLSIGRNDVNQVCQAGLYLECRSSVSI
jgi:hypothetical protein